VTRTFTADCGDANVRIDLVLCRRLADVPRLTRTRVQAWIEEGRVLMNDVAVRRPSVRPPAGSEISVLLPDGLVTPRKALGAEAIELDVLFEDDHFLVINKPAGLVMHPTFHHGEGTIMNALMWRARGWRDGSRPSLVQRLDKLTSGVVVIAKTSAVHAALQRSLASGRGEKDYLAVVYGKVSPARGTIDLRLARDRKDRRRVVASATEGAASVTNYERLAHAKATPLGLSLVRCRLLTGRMHQIRVHLSAAGWPLVGDPSYGLPRWREIADVELAAQLRDFPRQALHAWRLAFIHPIARCKMEFEAPLPQDFQTLLRATGLNLRHDLLPGLKTRPTSD
jgi:23S rRNA pseudouridine1911/1915/1917 synthase